MERSLVVSRPSALRLVFGALVLGGVALGLTRGVHWRDVAHTLKGMSAPLLVVVIALNACLMSVKAVRLRVLLNAPGATWAGCFAALLTSSAINNLVPLRGGDVTRLWTLARHANVSKASVLGVAVVEHLLDILALGVVAMAGSLLLAGQSWARPASVVVAVVAAALLAILGWFGASRESAVRSPVSAGRLSKWRARGRAFVEGLRPGLRSLRDARRLGRGLGLSIVSWACETTMVTLCARAMGFSVSPPLAIVVLLGINLAIALPSLPSNAGPFEGAAVVVLSLASVAKPVAVAFALLYHAVQVIPVTAAGLVVLARGSSPLRRAIGTPRPVALSRSED
jgi:uncharacterized protein (TIRG00374 family)